MREYEYLSYQSLNHIDTLIDGHAFDA